MTREQEYWRAMRLEAEAMREQADIEQRTVSMGERIFVWIGAFADLFY